MICELTEDNYCPRHKTYHQGRLLELSQLDTPEGESYRLLWTDKKGDCRRKGQKTHHKAPRQRLQLWKKTKLILHFKQAPGDTLVASGAIECLHSQYPENTPPMFWAVGRCYFENSPHRSFNHGQGQEIVMDNPLINQATKPRYTSSTATAIN